MMRENGEKQLGWRICFLFKEPGMNLFALATVETETDVTSTSRAAVHFSSVCHLSSSAWEGRLGGCGDDNVGSLITTGYGPIPFL